MSCGKLKPILMKAKTRYNDFTGTVAADISDYLEKGSLNALIPRNVPGSERYTVVDLNSMRITTK